MDLNPHAIEVIGFISGAIIAFSALPRAIDLARHEDKARHESTVRNLALTVGNVGWIVVGMSKPTFSLVIMCGVAAVLNGAVLILVLRAKRSHHENSSEQSLPLVPAGTGDAA